MEFQFYLRIIQRGWWLIVISALAAVNVSLVYSYYMVTPMYESVARFIVSPNIQNIESRDWVNSLEALDKRSIISTYAEVLNSPQIASSAIKLLGKNPEDYSEYTMSVAVLPDANIIRFGVRGPDPQVAAMLANSVGQYAIDYIRNLYIVYDFAFLDHAIPPAEPYRPQPVQDALLAFLIGTVIGLSLAVFRDQISSTLDRLGRRKMLDYESLAYTRPYFERLVRQEISNQPDGVITLGIIYLNGIQEYYDSLPQPYANKIMRRVTDILKNQLRGNDAVGRWSQLHFSIFLPSTNGEAAVRRMERVRDTLAEPFSLDSDKEFTLSLDPCIGLADRQGGEPFPLLMEQATHALEISLQSDKKVSLYKVRPFG